MADAAVEFLLGNLHQLLNYHTKLIRGARDQVEKLENDLRFFRAFLKRSSTKRMRKDDTFLELARQIRNVVYEAEDIVDAFVTQAAKSRSRNFLVRAYKTPVNLHGIATQIESINGKINEIYNKDKLDFATHEVGDESTEKPEVPLVRRDNVVGFSDDADKIIGYLTENRDELEVISIIGMPGLGKTTLAGKIFRNDKICRHFPIRIWIYVSQEFTRKDVYLAILREFGFEEVFKQKEDKKLDTISKKNDKELAKGVEVYKQKEDKELAKLTEEEKKHLKLAKEIQEQKHVRELIEEFYKQKNDQELAEEVYSHLENKKFLIVMDDVWTTEDWDGIQIAIPKSNNFGKMLITSRNKQVALYANPHRGPYMLQLLTEEESWLLLWYEVFARLPKCLSELEDLGKQVASQCGGLPLAIVVIGGILVQKFKGLDNINATRVAWEKVSHSVSAYINKDPQQRMEKIIGLSYMKLPYHLRACFLYFGMFPEDFEIPAWKLILMWIAEGFIRPKDGISQEDSAENYLDELVDRNLVRVVKWTLDGRVKTCRMHDMLRDFCKNEAGNEKENFLQEMKWTPTGFEHSVAAAENCRRICIHSNVINFLTKKPSGPRVRSFVCFSDVNTALPVKCTSTIPNGFKLLRVLYVNPIRFAKIPTGMYRLMHLRFLALSFNLAALPAAFAELWNIETLIVDTSKDILHIKADIWKMSQLRHLKTNVPTILPEGGKGSKEGEKLQTLGTISLASCTEEVFDRAPNLKKLAIHRLRAICSRRLPPPGRFPSKLKSLTLSETYLHWVHMSTLGALENLEVLKLKDYAFLGSIWEVKDGGFSRLEVLHIGRTDLRVWTASSHSYPKLRRLRLHHCEELLNIPFCLDEIPSFRTLELFDCHDEAVECAIEIFKVKQRIYADGQFKFSVDGAPFSNFTGIRY